MALEALARAIEQTGRDYFNYKMEDSNHARDRAEKLTDEERARAEQRKWFDYTSAEGLKHDLTRDALITAQHNEDEAHKLGIDTTGMTPAQMGSASFTALLSRATQTKAAEVDASAKATLDAAVKYRPAQKAFEDDNKEEDRVNLYDQYQGLAKQAQAVASQHGVALADPDAFLAPLAKQKLDELFRDPNARASVLASNGIKTIADQTAFGQKSDVEKARLLNLISPGNEAAAQRAAYDKMTADANFPRTALEGLTAQKLLLDRRNVDERLNVNPFLSYEAQTFSKPKGLKPSSVWFNPTPDPAPPTTATAPVPAPARIATPAPAPLLPIEETLQSQIQARGQAEALRRASDAQAALEYRTGLASAGHGDGWWAPSPEHSLATIQFAKKQAADAAEAYKKTGGGSPITATPNWFKNNTEDIYSGSPVY